MEWRYITSRGQLAQASDQLVAKTSTFAAFWASMEKQQLADHIKEDAKAFQREGSVEVRTRVSSAV
jgi:head-tail adaptor